MRRDGDGVGNKYTGVRPVRSLRRCLVMDLVEYLPVSFFSYFHLMVSPGADRVARLDRAGAAPEHESGSGLVGLAQRMSADHQGLT